MIGSGALGRARERWGGGIRPSPAIEHTPASVIRWDGSGEGPGWIITAEGFGLSLTAFIGRTPARNRKDEQ